MPKRLFFKKSPLKWRGTGGASPGEQEVGGVREMGEERAGSRREIQRGKLLFFVTAYFQSEKQTQ